MTVVPAPHNTDYSEGPLDARIMLVGQNPGREEVRTNRPFVGRSGTYLNKVLEQVGLSRRTLYITSIVKEPTPQNRPPTREEIRRWMPVIKNQMERIRPAFVLLMGRIAWQTPRICGITYIETYHPAAAMRFPKIRERFEKDVADLRRRAGV